VEPADVLLERATPGERHREDQSIERRVIEPLSDEPSGREQTPRRRRVEPLEFVKCLRPLTSPESTVQHDRLEARVEKLVLENRLVPLALGERQHASSVVPGGARHVDDLSGAALV